MNKTGKIILWVLAIAAVVALFVINGSRAYHKQQLKESQALRNEMQLRQVQKKQEQKRMENGLNSHDSNSINGHAYVDLGLPSGT